MSQEEQRIHLSFMHCGSHAAQCKKIEVMALNEAFRFYAKPEFCVDLKPLPYVSVYKITEPLGV
ncbi:MAG: hypothetical protein RLZZ453_735 [Chlamydiota bacterium]|jgi:hypothetical protein